MKKILDMAGNEITEWNESLGHLEPETVTIHHDAIPAIEKRSHIEVLWENPDDPGNRLEQVVIDQPYVPGKDAWDEEQEIMRYVPYTAEELTAMAEEAARAEAEMEKERIEAEARAAVMESLPDALDDLATQVATNTENIEIQAGAIDDLAQIVGGENG